MHRVCPVKLTHLVLPATLNVYYGALAAYCKEPNIALNILSKSAVEVTNKLILSSSLSTPIQCTIFAGVYCSLSSINTTNAGPNDLVHVIKRAPARDHVVATETIATLLCIRFGIVEKIIKKIEEYAPKRKAACNKILSCAIEHSLLYC